MHRRPAGRDCLTSNVQLSPAQSMDGHGMAMCRGHHGMDDHHEP